MEETNMLCIHPNVYLFGILVISLVTFVWLVCVDWSKKETKLSDKDAKAVEDDMYVLIQKQEYERLMLIEREDKDVELDKED